jgi:hypothetical protein
VMPSVEDSAAGYSDFFLFYNVSFSSGLIADIYEEIGKSNFLYNKPVSTIICFYFKIC